MKPIKMGIEIEYLVATSAGKNIDSGYGRTVSDVTKVTGLKILNKAAANINAGIKPIQDRHGHVRWDFTNGSSLMPDTFSLLETVTGPSSDLDVLRDQLWTMKSALIEAAKSHGCVVSAAACPVSYKYDDIRSSANVRCNNAGMHIHLEALNDEVKIKFANLLTQLIPELTAIAANSSVYDKQKSKYASKRLSVSPLVGAKAVEVYKLDPDNPLQWDDPNKRYRFVSVFTKGKKTIELRGFDTPMNIDWAMAIAALIQCLAVKATRLFVVSARNTVMSNSKTLRGKNFDAAVENGFRAKFQPDKTTHMVVKGKSQPMSFLYHNHAVDPTARVPAPLAIKRLLYYVEQEAYELGLTGYLQPLYEAVKSGKNQASMQHAWMDEGSFANFLKNLDAEGGKRPCNLKKPAGVKRKYFTVRQKTLKTNKDRVYLTLGGLRHLGISDGDTIILSGPLGNLDVKVAKDKVESETIPLGDNEIRMSRSYRNKLGVSMYDPVIAGKEAFKPIVVLKSGAKWAFTPETGGGGKTTNSDSFVVQAGIKKYAPAIVLNTRDAKVLGLADGDKVKLRSGDKEVAVAISTLGEVKSGVIAMMAKTRDALGVKIHGKVSVQKSGEGSAASEGRKMNVCQGDRADIGCELPVVRVHKATMTAMGIEDGGDASLRVSSTDGKENIAVIVRADRKGHGRNDIGIVKELREQFGVRPGDTIVIKS
ncbi:MAG: hypothetical protein JJU29_01825 [Verrucomicrobia bacterium]|nr:hypothetical protein [Verrucomicrobiota bacterium]MCH8510972.1 hypothetical protein [Kiritimatiellia bacterium]